MVVVDLMLEVIQDLVLAAELVISQCQIHRHRVKHLILELVEKVVMVVMVLEEELVVEEDNPLLDLVDVEAVLDLVVGLVVAVEAVVPLL